MSPLLFAPFKRVVCATRISPTALRDVGLHFGVGADYRLTESLSLGMDCRYNYNLTREGGSWLTTGVYLGFDF